MKEKSKIIIAIVIAIIAFVSLLLMIPIEKKRELISEYGILAENAETDEMSAYILENIELYPKDILEFYYSNWENNVEFVYDYPEHKDDYLTMSYTEEELSSDTPPKLYMYDYRWAYQKFAGSFIKTNGCALMCMTMAYIHFTGNSDIDPYIIAQTAIELDAISLTGGIVDEKVTEICEAIGLKAETKRYCGDYQTGKTQTVDVNELTEIIDNGHLAMLGMVGETFGTHAILVYGYNEEGFLINDPASEEKTQKIWEFDELEPEIYFIYELSK